MKQTLVILGVIALIGCEPVLEVGIVPPTVPSQPTQPPIDVDCEDCDPETFTVEIEPQAGGFVTQPLLVGIVAADKYYNPKPVPTIGTIEITETGPHPPTDGEL